MGIQINGNTNNINAGIGSLSIEDINELDIVGVATAANFKTGVSNLHSVGLSLSGGQIDVGSNIKLGNAGVVTATSFVGSGANLTSLPAQATIANNADNRVITGGSGVNLNGEANLTFDGTHLVVSPTSASNTIRTKIRASSANDDGRLGIYFGNTEIAALFGKWSGSAFSTGLNIPYEPFVVTGASGAERLRIDSAGNLSLGKGSASSTNYGTNLQIHSNSTNGASLHLTDNTTGSSNTDGFHIISTGGAAYLWQRENANMVFGTLGNARWNIYGSNGHLAPNADSTYDIGTNTVRVRNIYADTLYGSGANLTSLPSSTPPKNFLINGAMTVNVRGTNHQTANSFNPVTDSIYTLDRWKVMNGSSFDTDSAKVQKSTNSPDGFSSSMKWDIGNTETPSASQNCGIEQKIEGQNLQELAYGTSSAKTMTLSFWVYSNKTGTYCVHIMQEDGTKYQMHEYTISSSNTWEKKTITIVGNTSNAINDDNTTGLRIIWVLTVGSGDHVAATSTWASGGDLAGTSNQVNLWDHADNHWYLTGCQLEVGSTATDYIHEDYGTTLRKCQRYFFALCGPVRYETIGTGMIYYSGTGYANAFFPVSMRTQPALVALSGTSGSYIYQTLLSNTAAYTHQIGIDSGKTTLQSATLTCACPANRNGEAFRLSAHFSHDSNNGQSFVNFDAEL